MHAVFPRSSTGTRSIRTPLAQSPLARALFAGLGALAAIPLAHAEGAGQPDATTLDRIVVSGEREPGNFAIDREEIELTQAADLADLLSNQSGVAVGGGAPVAQKVYVRGFEDTLLNVTIDGAQLPAELYHHQARLQVEPEFVKSIELDAGAGAATAGAGALTGALRVATRNAFDMLDAYGDPQRRFGMLLKGAVGFNGEDNHKGVTAVYGLLGDNIGAMATWVQHDGGDYDDGHGERVSPTAFEHARGQARLTGLFGDHTADLTVQRLHDTGAYYERPHMVDFAGRFVLSDHEMTRETASYRHNYDPMSEAIDVQATAYWNRNDFQNHRNTTGALYGRGEQTSTGLDLRNTARWSQLDLTYGVDYRHDELRARQQATPPPFWGSTEQSVRMLGAYGQGAWRPSSAWLLSAGVRWDNYHHRVDAGLGAGNTNSQARFSPNASIQWQPTEHLSLRAAYAEAFRGVTIREAFFSALYLHDGTLEGEQADNIEIGLAWQRDGWFARATAFRQHIENYIAPVYTGDVSPVWGRWENIGRAQVDGYELEAGRDGERWDVGLGVWNSDNELNDQPLNDSNLGLGASIGRTWTARVDWQPASHAGHYGLRARHVEDEANSISPTAPDKPGYTVVDLLANWRLDAADRVQLGVAINNLFDRFYYDHGTYGYHPSGKYIGFPASGREVVASLRWRF